MKTLSFLLASIVFMSSCSQKGSSSPSEKNKVEKIEKKSASKNETAKAIKMLLKSNSPNFALAELLIKTIPEAEKAAAQSLLSTVSEEEAVAILEDVKKRSNQIRKAHIFYGNYYQDDEELLNDLFQGDGSKIEQSLETQLRVTAFTYIKNRSLNEVLSTFNSRSEELTKELSESIALEIAKDSKTSAEIEELNRNRSKEDFIKKVKKLSSVSSKVDKYFKSSKLNETEQVSLLLSGAIAGGIYVILQKHEKFRHFEKQVRKVIKDVTALSEKAKELGALLKTIDKHVEDTNKNINDFSDGIYGSRRDLKDLVGTMKDVNIPKVDVHNIEEFLRKQVIGKKIIDNGSNGSILSAKRSISSNVLKSVNAVGGMANNLSGMLTSFNKISTLMGIKPSPSLQKVIQKAQQVSAVVSSIGSIAAGYMTGGPLGAMGALSSSPLMSMMGGGGGDGNAAALAEINQKLDEVLKLQKKIVEMQFETMKMIKELAVMVDKYHQEEMIALSQINKNVIVGLEMQQLAMNTQMAHCEALISYRLQGLSNKGTFSSIYNIEATKSAFYTSIKSIENLKATVNSTSSQNFDQCSSGFSLAFSTDEAKHTPMRAIYSTTLKNEVQPFEEYSYLPLVRILKDITSELDNAPLHLPVKSVKSVHSKSNYLNNNGNAVESLYDLNNLISVQTLERYASNLLLLYPLLDLTADQWNQKKASSIVNDYLEKTAASDQNVTSYFYLKNALRITQNAIAQEALLAGEPILEKLYKDRDIIFNSKSCHEAGENNKRICAVRNNEILLKNAILYTLYKNGRVQDSFYQNYKAAYESLSSVKIAQLLNSSLPATAFSIKNKQVLASLSGSSLKQEQAKIVIAMPTPEELKSGELVYSENMTTLLKMQDLILDALEKVVPGQIDWDKDVMKLMLVNQAS